MTTNSTIQHDDDDDNNSKQWAVKVPFGKDYLDNPSSWLYVTDFNNIEKVKTYASHEQATAAGKVWRIFKVVEYKERTVTDGDDDDDGDV
jgi:hypothetical protein